MKLSKYLAGMMIRVMLSLSVMVSVWTIHYTWDSEWYVMGAAWVLFWILLYTHGDFQ